MRLDTTKLWCFQSPNNIKFGIIEFSKVLAMQKACARVSDEVGINYNMGDLYWDYQRNMGVFDY